MDFVLNQNFKTYTAQMFLGSAAKIEGSTTQAQGNAASGTSNLPMPLKDTSNTNRTSFYNNSSSAKLSDLSSFNYWIYNNSMSVGYVYFQLGSGTTQPTINDYALETPILNATIEIHGNDVAYYNNKYSLTYTLTITASENTTINEIGMLRNFKSSSSSTTSFEILFGRGVFDEPINLATGESKVITVSIEM